jgi:hypothetical protein
MTKMFMLVGAVALMAIVLGRQPAAAQGGCVGDCDGSGAVTIDEIITMVNVALGTASVDACPAGDASGEGEITVDEVIQAVNNSLNDCPSVPTPTPTPPPSGCAEINAILALDFDPSSVPSLAGVSVSLDYPSTVSIPAGMAFERVSDISQAGGFFDVQDLDTDSNGSNDRLNISYVTTANLQPGGFVFALFDCDSGVALPEPGDFTCTITSASDGGGFPVTGVNCVVEVQLP